MDTDTVFSDEDLQELWSLELDLKKWFTKPSILLTDHELRQKLILKAMYGEFNCVYQVLNDIPGTRVNGGSDSKHIVVYMTPKDEDPYFIVTTLVDGILSGYWYEYFLDDQPRKRRYFDPVSGALNGPYEVFWSKGGRRYYAEFSHGRLHGPAIDYNENRKMVRFRIFEYDRPVYDSSRVKSE